MEASAPPVRRRGSRCHGPNKSPKSLQGALDTAQHRFIMYIHGDLTHAGALAGAAVFGP